MKQNRIIKMAVLVVSLIIIGMTVTPTTQAHFTKNEAHHIVSTEFIGILKNKTEISLSDIEYESLLGILKNLEYNLKSTETNEEALALYTDALEELHSMRLFGAMDITVLTKMCTRQHRLIHNIEIPINIEKQFASLGGDNAFCLLLSHIKGFVYDHGLLFALAVLVAISALPFIIIFYPLGAIINSISEQIFALQHKTPFIPPFPHRVETRFNESYSNLISQGLYGRVNNDYTNWGFRFDAFTGVRINIDRDETLRINESYYLGSALFVSWNYDGPH